MELPTHVVFEHAISYENKSSTTVNDIIIHLYYRLYHVYTVPKFLNYVSEWKVVAEKAKHLFDLWVT